MFLIHLRAMTLFRLGVSRRILHGKYLQFVFHSLIICLQGFFQFFRLERGKFSFRDQRIDLGVDLFRTAVVIRFLQSGEYGLVDFRRMLLQQVASGDDRCDDTENGECEKLIFFHYLTSVGSVTVFVSVSTSAVGE